MDLTPYVLPASLVVMGNVMHLLKKVIELRRSGIEDMTLTKYVETRPYLTVFGFLSSVGVFMILSIQDPVTALLTGFSADSAMDGLGRKSVT